jgi:DNA-binding NtrC family response regulator
MQDTADSPLFTTRLAVVEGDRRTAEMLHTFFRLMELDVALVDPGNEAADTICRLAPAVVLIDLDLPDLRALDLAHELATRAPNINLLFATAHPQALAPPNAIVVAKPKPTYEEMLRVLEAVLELM